MGVQHLGPTTIDAAADSPEEWSFLVSISDDYTDDVPKLVYADWLDERGDPRGNFLREFVLTAKDSEAPLPEGEEFPRAWRDVVGVRPLALIRRLILDGDINAAEPDLVERGLMRLARPTLYLFDSPTDDAHLPHGCTKYGGLPDLPPGVAWPVAVLDGGETIVPVFCAQIRLSDLRGCVAAKELPSKGFLSFFKNEGDRPPVIFSPEADPYHRPKPPPRTSRIQYHMEHFYPLPAGRMRLVEGIDLYEESEEIDWDALEQIKEELNPGQDRRWCPHQLMGNGSGYSTGAEPPGFRRLATFGSDIDGPHYWGDSGQPIWRISEEDLAAGRFEKAECYCG